VQLQPAVRILLTALAAGLGVVVATLDDETVRIIGMAILAALAAVGITPPQVPTRTSIDTERQPVSVVRDE
jgi:hypothetical protein